MALSKFRDLCLDDHLCISCLQWFTESSSSWTISRHLPEPFSLQVSWYRLKFLVKGNTRDFLFYHCIWFQNVRSDELLINMRKIASDSDLLLTVVCRQGIDWSKYYFDPYIKQASIVYYAWIHCIWSHWSEDMSISAPVSVFLATETQKSLWLTNSQPNLWTHWKQVQWDTKQRVERLGPAYNEFRKSNPWFFAVHTPALRIWEPIDKRYICSRM